jgi:hypothetical protein
MHILHSLFYLTTALHVLGVTVTHLQEHKTTVTTASGKRYTVLNLLKTSSCTFCKIHSPSHLKLQLLKMFVKHIIKNPIYFGRSYLTILRGRPLC